MVSAATRGCSAKFEVAWCERFRPMMITTAPVTTGGMTDSSSRTPSALTAMPTTITSRPAATTPPSCAEMPCSRAATSGATKANDEPR